MVIINPDKSTYIREDAPDTNYGANDEIIQGLPNYLHRGLVEFDISGITVGDVVSAKLRLYLTYESDCTRTHYAQRVTSAWTESGVTWNTQPTSTTTNLASAVIVGVPLNPDRWIEWDVTNLLKDEGGSTLGILMKDSVETSSISDYFRYDGRTKSNPPQLLIDNDFYVKTGGNDSNNGQSWANAWATVNKAATTVSDGGVVHIGFGTYNAEPANNDIAPVNAGTFGIKYLPETETTGGGTGSVIVEVN